MCVAYMLWGRQQRRGCFTQVDRKVKKACKQSLKSVRKWCFDLGAGICVIGNDLTLVFVSYMSYVLVLWWWGSPTALCILTDALLWNQFFSQLYADCGYKYKGEKVSPKIATIIVFLTFFYFMAFIFDCIKQVKDEIALEELGVVLSLYSQLLRGWSRRIISALMYKISQHSLVRFPSLCFFFVVCAHRDQKLACSIISQVPPTLFLRWGLLLEPGTVWLGHVDWPENSISSRFHLPSTGITSACSHVCLLMFVAGVKVRSPCLMLKTVFPICHQILSL